MIVDIKYRVLHLIDTSGQGGAEQVFASLVKSLSCNHYVHHIILNDEGWLYQQLIDSSDVRISVYNGHGKFNIKYLYYLVCYVVTNRINIIHAHLLGTSLYASIAGFLSGLPIICTFHGFVDLRSTDLLLKLKLNVISLCASRVVAVSNGLMDCLINNTMFGRNKFITIYNGTGDQTCNLTSLELRRYYGYIDDDILIGSIGNIKPAKGYDLLLKVAKIITTRYNNCIFIIAGNTDSDIYNDLLELRKMYQLESKVQFLGYQDNISHFLKLLDVFLLTSNSEGFSLATIEAMRAGIPVVATKCGGPQEIISHSVTGYLADIGNEIEIAQRIIDLIENPDIKTSITTNAKVCVNSKYDIKSMIYNYDMIYRNILKEVNSGDILE